MMSREEFEKAFEGMRSKLTQQEYEMLMRIIHGAEINHALVYTIVAFVLGILAGVCGTLLAV